MFSLSAEISLIAIVLFFLGPAYVFIKTQVTFWNIANRRRSNNQAPTITSGSPLNDTFTYTTFPLVLAATIYMTGEMKISPFEGLNTDYLELLATPLWLIKYSAFTGFLSAFAMMFGWLNGFLTPTLLQIIRPEKRDKTGENRTIECQCSQKLETRGDSSDE